MEGPAYFLIGCPVIRRVRAGTDCHRLASVPTLATYRYFGPIVLAIIALLFIVALSYTQVVRVNPGGGGSYGIAMKYLGVYPALTAGAALLADYILTVAVSISSGTAALVSAFPVLHPYHVYLDLGVLILMMIVNLRGTREASTVFVWPTYFFLAAMGITLIGGFYQIWNGTLTAHTVAVETVAPLNQTALMLIVLRAFANGCSSMTGIEAIANGVTMFKAPQQKNAIETTAVMACILAIMLGGLGYLIIYLHLLPTQGYTLLSLLVEDIFSRTLIYYVIQILMMVILYIAANTAYNGLPPLLSFMAVDGYVPRYFANRGERLSYSNGIQVLTLMAGILIVLFQGNIEHLISLYAIGVFLSFTIAQSAMVSTGDNTGNETGASFPSSTASVPWSRPASSSSSSSPNSSTEPGSSSCSSRPWSICSLKSIITMMTSENSCC